MFCDSVSHGSFAGIWGFQQEQQERQVGTLSLVLQRLHLQSMVVKMQVAIAAHMGQFGSVH